MATATISLTSTAGSSLHQGGFYRPDIDGLRAIAIISVVAFHARLPFFGGGFIGVDVFLVISGYLIGLLVYREIRESKFSVLRFYERRVKRILPALFAVLFVCNLIAFLLLSPLELRNYCGESFSASFSSSNIYFSLRSDYFTSAAAFKPLLMTWSLGIEEQFYLLFPLSLFLLHRFTRRRVLQWVAIVSGLSFVCCVVCTNIYPSAAFYLLPMRAWELGLGILIAVHEVEHEGPVKLSATVANALGWLGLGLIVAPVLAYSEATRFPGFAAVLPTVGTACLINSRDSLVNRRLLSSRPMIFIGLVSYSWYLWHWPLLSFARIVSGGLLSVPRAVLITVISLLLATVSHRYIELPFRKSRAPTAQLLVRYGALVLLFGTVPLLGYRQSGWPSRIPELVKVEASVRETQHNVCLTGFDESTPRLRPACVVEGTGPKLALWGDSHAAVLGTAMRQLAVGHGYGFEELTKASCPPLPTAQLRWSLRPTFEGTCTAFNHAVLQRLLGDRSITVVVLAGLWSSLCSDGGSGDCDTDNTQARQGGLEARGHRDLHSVMLETITLLRSSGKRVFIVTDVPRFAVDPMSIVRNSVMRSRGELASLLSSRVFSLAPVNEASLLKPTDTITNIEVRQAASEGGAEIIDLAQNLCPASRCRFWDNGVLLYADSGHLTPAGAEYALRGQDPISHLH